MAMELGHFIPGVIEAFGRARLLSFDRDQVTRSPTVQVAHEALLREWDRLRQWLADSRDDLRLRRQLASAARSWDEADRDPEPFVQRATEHVANCRETSGGSGRR